MQQIKRPYTGGASSTKELKKLKPIVSKGLGGYDPDRFIPQKTCHRAYKASPSLKKFDVRHFELVDSSPSPERLSSPEFFTDLRNTGHYDSINEGFVTPESSLDQQNSTRDSLSHSSHEQEKHRGFIADSLGFQSPQRVLLFATPNTSGDHSEDSSFGEPFTGVGSNHYLAVDPLLTALPPGKAMVYLATSAFSKMNQSHSFVKETKKRRPAKRVKSYIPYRVLDAPCLRNDFYSNLVSWSKTTDNVIVGLGCSVYMWSDSQGAIPVLNHDYLNSKRDVVTCVSFCPTNTLFVVGTKQGRLLLYDQELCMERYKHGQAPPKCLTEYQSITLRGISCVQWHIKSSEDKLLIGEECGDISYLTVRAKSGPFTLEEPDVDYTFDSRMQNENPVFPGPRNVSQSNALTFECLAKFQAQAQQVCGISMNEDSSLLAVGGNDNTCTLWDISSIEHPRLCFILPHKAAVKAVAFCPWSKSLLATGGGSKDRTIKFWHTATGTLLHEIQTSGQVTSLIWSTRYKQIVATFGFGDIEDPILITLYSYPQLIPLTQVRTSSPLRVLSAVPSPSMTSICVATNDETIRFYELWNDKQDVINEAQESGLYGSDIIEYVEGIENVHEKMIR
ncbi:AMA1 (YGR225W) [Zygosaccharomyces parabailii]|nr:AMA1 (YGR225W) [Zygosaccharomyces parabailii]